MVSRIRRFFAPPIFCDDNLSRVASLLNLLLLAAIGMTVVFVGAAALVIPNEAIVLEILLILLVLYVIPYMLLRWRRVRTASHALVIVAWLIWLVASVIAGGINYVGFSSQIVIILIVALLLGWREVIGYTAFGLLATAILAVAKDQQLLPNFIGYQSSLYIWIVQAGLLSLSGMLLYTAVRTFNKLLARTRNSERVVNQQNRELQAEISERKRVEAIQQTSEASTRAFQERLKTLHEVSNQLTRTNSPDELCKQAVEIGRSRLGYDRLGIWFLDNDHTVMIGSYGTDEQGQTRDERHHRYPVPDNHTVKQAIREHLDCIVYNDAPLYNAGFEAVGTGWKILAMMLDGENIIGWISADNYISNREMTEADVEILKLYSATLGHLVNRKRAEEAAFHFQISLKALNEVGIALARTNSLDQLCFQGIEIGRAFLGVDRMGIWLRDENDPAYLVGTYGTDEQGQTRDERGRRFFFSEEETMIAEALLTRTSQIMNRQVHDLNANVIGETPIAMALLWDGDQTMGALFADNLLSRRPISDYDMETLTLYGSILGHLVSRKRAEAELLKERNLLRTIIDTTSDFIYVKDLQSRFLLVNKPSWKTAPGVTSESDMIGKTDADFYAPELAEKFLADEKAIFAAGQAIINQEEPGRPDEIGPTIMLTSKIPLYDKQGNISGLVGITRDITNTKRAEAALRKSEERLRLATNSAKLGTWDWDVATRRITWGNYAQALLGLEQEDTGGLFDQFVAYIDPLDQAKMADAVRQSLNDDVPFDVEYRYSHPDGSLRWMSLEGEVYRDDDGNPTRMVGIIRDITEQKQAERERLDFALQKERLNLLTEFIGNMSHDLKTPLSVIKTSLYLLEQLKDPVRQQAKIEVIKEQTLLLEKLIQDVLTMSRLDHDAEPTFGPVNLIRIIREAEAKLRPNAERKRQMIHLELEDDMTSVLGSEQELLRMMTNLIENAVNYTQEEGQITVRSFAQNGNAFVEVSDTGIGIKEADLPRIFDRFFRADPARSVNHGGTGLGLAIVKKIVEMHAGSIQVESQPGVGTTFHIALMLNPGAPPRY